MKALILAAGLGTRLMPLTASTPKALVKVGGTPLLELAIRNLAGQGFTEIIINVHHLAGQVIEFVQPYQQKGVKLSVSDESDNLLDTGGAILKARWFLDGNKPFLVHNVDVISGIDLNAMHREHLARKSLATLAVSRRETSRYFLFNQQGFLCGWKDVKHQVTRWAGDPVTTADPLAFSGVHMISPDIFRLFEETGRFSIIDAYLRLAAHNPIGSFTHPSGQWFDVGKPGQIAPAAAFLSSLTGKPDQP